MSVLRSFDREYHQIEMSIVAAHILDSNPDHFALCRDYNIFIEISMDGIFQIPKKHPLVEFRSNAFARDQIQLVLSLNLTICTLPWRV